MDGSLTASSHQGSSKHIPEDVRVQFAQLINIYTRPTPKCNVDYITVNPKSHEGAFQGNSRWKCLRQKKDRVRSAKTTPPIPDGYIDSDLEPRWALGPGMSTNDIIKAVVSTSAGSHGSF